MQVGQAAHKQPGADQQQQGESHLGRYQQLAETDLGRAAHCVAGLIFQSGRDIGFGRLQRRRQTKDDPSDQRECQREAQHADVGRACDGIPGQLAGQKGYQSLDHQNRQAQARRCPR